MVFPTVVFTTIIVLDLTATSDGICCPNYYYDYWNSANNYGRCGDCSSRKPCCATGACNIFCCNCGGQCLRGRCYTKRAKRFLSTDHFDGNFIVASADSNGDEKLSIEEAVSYLSDNQFSNTSRIRVDLELLDKNGDNLLSPLEIDEDDL